jgi:hypothetical protein
MAGAAPLTPAPSVSAGRSRWRRRLVEDAILVAVAAAAAMLIRSLVAQVYYISVIATSLIATSPVATCDRSPPTRGDLAWRQ